MKKSIEKICKTCRLYNPRDGVCSVVIVYQGEKFELPVQPNDSCYWETIDKEVQEELQSAIQSVPGFKKEELEKEMNYPIEVKQVRIWSDGKNGFIETPEEGCPSL